MRAFKDKVVLVTGGSSGIGLAIAAAFASVGAKVVITARNAVKLQEALVSLQAKGLSVTALVADVSVEADCHAMVEKTVQQYGRLDVLVNNAGLSMRALFQDLDLDVLHKLMQTNFWGAVYATQAALPHLIEKDGSIVNISSVAGLRPLPGRTGYSSSKAALQAFMDSLRVELLPTKVHILTVYPGYVETNIRKAALLKDGQPQGDTPLNEQKLMSAERVASAVLEATAERKRDLILGMQGKMTVFLNKWFPAWMDKVVWKFMQREGPMR